MLNIKPLAAFAASWTGSSKGKASRLSQRKGGPLAAARANVDRVHRQVADFERSCVWHGVDETDHTRRCVDGFYAAVRHHDAARRWRLRFYQLNSRMLTPVFQSDSAVVGMARDAFMGPLCYFPLSRLQMLTTLVGAQNNGVPWTTIPEEEFMGFTR